MAILILEVETAILFLEEDLLEMETAILILEGDLLAVETATLILEEDLLEVKTAISILALVLLLEMGAPFLTMEDLVAVERDHQTSMVME